MSQWEDPCAGEAITYADEDGENEDEGAKSKDTNECWIGVDVVQPPRPSFFTVPRSGGAHPFEHFDTARGELPAFLRRDGSTLWAMSRARWDFLNAQWNRWFLAYGPELQQAFLSRLGVRGWTQMLLWLTGLITALLLLVAAWLLWRGRPAPPADAASRSWRRPSGQRR